MYSRLKNIPAINGTLVLTPDRVLITCVILVLMSYGVYAHAIFTAQDMNLQAGPPVGGDFVAFWAAARAVLDGLAADIYQMQVFEAYLLDNAMPRERFGLTWQYPPTYYFFIMPLAVLPFFPGYVIWSGGTMLLFIFVLSRVTRLKWAGLLILFAAPVMFNAVITGQNGFLTASLLVLAAACPDKRPVLAGLAAGLLTFKPQLGVLLPIAFIAAGCWRAFFTAAGTAIALACASVLVFGLDAWAAFFESIINVGGGVKDAVYPIHKMPTVFAALHKSGLPSDVAMAAQVLAALATMALVGLVWRRIKAPDLRAAVLCSAVFLCSPYAYYYEMTVLVLPVIVIVKRALEDGWLPGEEIGIALVWMAPLFLPGLSKYIGAQAGLALVLGLLWLALRRAHVAEGFWPVRSARVAA
ncbi:glycosyltransferase family 87 protein [Parvularcula sp. IMCC14364]|uniref:glycosyltransferase family 87 protein n=1 Tax=Parvularcula sp. IMCC14364 TaxID=3067902 RepID=UPI0027419709|nr:glycosyltransferase family 87 protein [Parvularcula sp. IMCC14364]